MVLKNCTCVMNTKHIIHDNNTLYHINNKSLKGIIDVQNIIVRSKNLNNGNDCSRLIIFVFFFLIEKKNYSMKCTIRFYYTKRWVENCHTIGNTLSD